MNSKTRLITKIAVFSAVAAVVMVLDFPLPFFPPFYKIDFSEVIVLISGFSFGVWPAVMIEAGKVLLSFLLNGTTTMGVGELANFLMGCSFIIPATLIYHHKKTKKNAMIGMGVGILSLCVTAALLNYFVILPIYASVYQMPIANLISMGTALNSNITNLFSFVVLAVVPFNIIKGSIASVITLLVYKRVTPLIRQQTQKLQTR